MKTHFALILLAVIFLAAPRSHAQVAVYGTFTATNPSGGPQSQYLYGATTGVIVPLGGPYHRALLEGDVQGHFVSKGGLSIDGVTLGPRFSIPLGGLVPFGEALVGFARNTDGVNPTSTDEMLQGVVGVNKSISNHLDMVVAYSYAQYAANFGELTPKSFSLGISYRFSKGLGMDGASSHRRKKR